MPEFGYQGSCHCGAIKVTLVTATPASALQVRACQCSFCTRHGGMTVSDPAGRATFDIKRRDLKRYQFATRSGTTLLCAVCGAYAGVIMEADGKIWSAINTRGLAIREFKDRAAESMVYDGETPEQRVARRKQRWTPTQLNFIE